MRRPGRPKLFDCSVEIRITDADKRVLRAAAHRRGLTLSEFARAALSSASATVAT